MARTAGAFASPPQAMKLSEMGHPGFGWLQFSGSVARMKIYVDGGGYFDWVAICDVGTVAPAADGVDGRAAEEPVAAQHASGDYRSVLRDDGLQDYLALNPGDSGKNRVVGLGRRDEMRGHDAGRDFEWRAVR